MSNNFERFIQKNRKEFDSETPSGNVWENIAKTIPARNEKRFSIKDIYKWSAVAAAIVFVILTSVYFLYIRKYSHENPIVKEQPKTESTNPIDINGIAPEYAVQFKKIYESVENQQEELKSASAGQPQLYEQFEEDLKVLDSAFTSLKNQAAHTPNRDVLIKAMIQNLQLQAELLGRQLSIIKEVKNTQTKKNETTI